MNYPQAVTGRKTLWAAPGDRARLAVVRVSAAFALLVTLAFERGLWLSSGRTYPTAPISPLLPAVPAPWDAGALAVIAVLLFLSAVPRRYRIPAAAAAFGLAACAMFDQSRWMPYVIEYAVLLLVAGTAGADRRSEASSLAVCRLVVASIYFWAGIHKINHAFIADTFPQITAPLVAAHPRLAALGGFGIAVPITEIAISVGLLFRGTRRFAIAAAAATHVIVLDLFSTGGFSWNAVVWFWNFMCVVLVMALFWDSDFGISEFRAAFIRRPAALIASVFYLALPLSGLIWGVDRYLEASIFAGDKARVALFTVDAAAYARAPQALRAATVGEAADGRVKIDIQAWSMRELGAFPYPEPRIYRNAARAFCPYAADPADVALELEGRPGFLDGRRTVSRFDCGDL